MKTNKLKLELDTETKKILIDYGASRKLEYQDAIAAIKYWGYEPTQRSVLEEALFNAESFIDPNNLSTSLHFLKETVFILTETGRKFIDKPYHLQDMIELYWDTYLTSKKTKTKIEPILAIDVCERYLELCEAEANQEWFERRALTSSESNGLQDASREDGMVSLSKILIDLKKSTMDALLLKKINQALRRVKRWLLLRYNLTEARKIEFEGGIFRFAASWLPEIGSSLVLSIVLCTSFSPWVRKELNASLFSCYSISTILIILFYLVSLIIFGKVFIPIFKRQKNPEFNLNTDLQIHLPRMASGIVVGYLVMFNIDAWNGIFFLDSLLRLRNQWLDIPWLSVGKVIIPLISVFFYILVEMNNVRGLSSRFLILKKAILLFIRGATYSILIGIVISDLFGRALVNSLISQYHVGKKIEDIFCLEGWFGYIYPEVLYLLAPLALFIGVFIQLLWEDKSLTEKI